MRLCRRTSFSTFAAASLATSSVNAWFYSGTASAMASACCSPPCPLPCVACGTNTPRTKSRRSCRRSRYTASAWMACSVSRSIPTRFTSASTAPCGTPSSAMSSISWIARSSACPRFVSSLMSSAKGPCVHRFHAASVASPSWPSFPSDFRLSSPPPLPLLCPHVLLGRGLHPFQAMRTRAKNKNSVSSEDDRSHTHVLNYCLLRKQRFGPPKTQGQGVTGH